MKLTLYTDYSLRVLLYLMMKDDGPVTIEDVTDFYGVSRSHLVKVVHNLGRLGLIDTVRGRGGGIRLADGARERRVGEVIRLVETQNPLVDCKGEQSGHACAALPVCTLNRALAGALEQFYAELDRYTLGDLVRKGPALNGMLASVLR